MNQMKNISRIYRKWKDAGEYDRIANDYCDEGLYVECSPMRVEIGICSWSTKVEASELPDWIDIEHVDELDQDLWPPALKSAYDRLADHIISELEAGHG